MFEDGELGKALDAGLRCFAVEAVNEFTAYDFPVRSLVVMSDDNPAAFQNLDKILSTADRIVLCELPLAPSGKLIVDAARVGRVVVIAASTPEAFNAWCPFVAPYQNRLLVLGTYQPRRLH